MIKYPRDECKLELAYLYLYLHEPLGQRKLLSDYGYSIPGFKIWISPPDRAILWTHLNSINYACAVMYDTPLIMYSGQSADGS